MTDRRRSQGLVPVTAVALALIQPAALAQSPLGPADEFRPLSANSQDIREGKDLVDTACAKCHVDASEPRKSGSDSASETWGRSCSHGEPKGHPTPRS
jgi:mono/diheme cytochrome c family protein